MKKFLIRDGSLIAIVVLLFVLAPKTALLQVATGLGIALVVYLLHEWSHYLAALRQGAVILMADSIFSPFLFSFDSVENTQDQFIQMSWPGFAATFISVAVLYFSLPDTLWAEVAWISVLVLTTFTLVVEGPIFLWAVFKQEVPAVEIPLIGKNSVLNAALNKLRGRD